MNKFFIATAFAAAIALPAAGQNTTSTANGQVQPTTAPVMKVKVAPSLANTARISADSAFAIARLHADSGEVSSGELETTDGRLLYTVQVLNRNKGESSVKIDAMTGELFDAKKHGGLKAQALHHKENKKLLEAKRDSAAKKP